ncbi:chromosome segregation ATPase, partial [filamentous cyanobacterium CCP5]
MADPSDFSQRPYTDSGLPPASSTAPQSPRFEAQDLSPTQSPLWAKIAKNWHVWSLASLAVVGSLGVVSAVSLFRIPNLPNCRAIFWPTASATTRIQCAEAFANQETVDGYLDAIKLVDHLPDDHPLRVDINQRIETWAEQVLRLAEFTFQEGDLSEAVDIARRIPDQTTAAELVSEQIDRWNEIWEKADGIYAEAQAELRQRNFQEAFAQANQLLDIGNRYWETTKYDEITALISDGRRDLNRLGQAKRLAQRKTVKGIMEAVEIAQAIAPESPLYEEAQG